MECPYLLCPLLGILASISLGEKLWGISLGQQWNRWWFSLRLGLFSTQSSIWDQTKPRTGLDRLTSVRSSVQVFPFLGFWSGFELDWRIGPMTKKWVVFFLKNFGRGAVDWGHGRAHRHGMPVPSLSWWHGRAIWSCQFFVFLSDFSVQDWSGLRSFSLLESGVWSRLVRSDPGPMNTPNCVN